MTGDLTVAELVEREGIEWPAADPGRGPRHALAGPDDLEAFWFGAPAPRVETPAVPPGLVDDDAPPRLVRAYAPPVTAESDQCGS